MLVRFNDKGKGTDDATHLQTGNTMPGFDGKPVELESIKTDKEVGLEAEMKGMKTAARIPYVPLGCAVSEPQQKPKPKSKSGNLFARIKKIKNFEIYLAVGLILIMIAIYLTTFGGGSSSTAKKTSEENYAQEMEAKLVKTLAQINGAGNVEAMVTVEGSATIEVAYNIDERTVTQNSGNGTATTTTTIVKTPVVINGSDGPQPLILFEIKPKVKGVVIIASGAFDVGVRLQLLRAVQTVIADDSVRIEIFTGK